VHACRGYAVRLQRPRSESDLDRASGNPPCLCDLCATADVLWSNSSLRLGRVRDRFATRRCVCKVTSFRLSRSVIQVTNRVASSKRCIMRSRGRALPTCGVDKFWTGDLRPCAIVHISSRLAGPPAEDSPPRLQAHVPEDITACRALYVSHHTADGRSSRPIPV
jgi:hypothetical protein